MMEKIEQLDQELFLWLNNLHHGIFDVVMYYVTNKYFWIPFYLFIIFAVVVKFKKQAFFIIPILILTVTICDQITSGFMKPFFERLRPCHDPIIGNLVHLVVDGCGGKFGFASSHASNHFGLATFLWLLFRNTYKWAHLIFIWAFLIAYSRVYVGVHYPGDILVGSLVGIIIGWLCFQIMKGVLKKFNTELVRSS
ncbi:phosphatase PAP2 family protein [Fulvivirgaceae bacterium BMA10]|uniref:Phosphatase PAP2 family protein n=1 Tax=Splendidivirga corallicola TaxID=3051826 RepID=A0ABT8KGA0_9BACT|nr:phosphatase PAP2 family protein [Fulvivirgaceae bacterium BMA10]